MKQFFGAGLCLFLPLQLMACVQHDSGPAWSLLSSNLGGPAQGAEAAREFDMNELHAPTVANKTLSAIAFERATGVKPVPSRLVKFD